MAASRVVSNLRLRGNHAMKHRFRLPFDTSRSAGFTTPLRLLLATTAAFWMGSAQPQTSIASTVRLKSESRVRGEFHPEPGHDGTAAVDALRGMDGRIVRLIGAMQQSRMRRPGRFTLATAELQSEKGSERLATVEVLLDPSQSDRVVPAVHGLVAVTGILQVGRAEEPDLGPAWLRLQLERDAISEGSAFELAGYLHRIRRCQSRC